MEHEEKIEKQSVSKPASEPKLRTYKKPGKNSIPVGVIKNGVNTGEIRYLNLSNPKVCRRIAQSMLEQDGEFD